MLMYKIGAPFGAVEIKNFAKGKVQTLRPTPPPKVSPKSFNFSLYYTLPMGIQVTIFGFEYLFWESLLFPRNI